MVFHPHHTGDEHTLHIAKPLNKSSFTRCIVSLVNSGSFILSFRAFRAEITLFVVLHDGLISSQKARSEGLWTSHKLSFFPSCLPFRLIFCFAEELQPRNTRKLGAITKSIVSDKPENTVKSHTDQCYQIYSQTMFN